MTLRRRLALLAARRVGPHGRARLGGRLPRRARPAARPGRRALRPPGRARAAGRGAWSAPPRPPPRSVRLRPPPPRDGGSSAYVQFVATAGEVRARAPTPRSPGSLESARGRAWRRGARPATSPTTRSPAATCGCSPCRLRAAARPARAARWRGRLTLLAAALGAPRAERARAAMAAALGRCSRGRCCGRSPTHRRRRGHRREPGPAAPPRRRAATTSWGGWRRASTRCSTRARSARSRVRSASSWPTHRTSCARRSRACAPTSRCCTRGDELPDGDAARLLGDLATRPRSSRAGRRRGRARPRRGARRRPEEVRLDELVREAVAGSGPPPRPGSLRVQRSSHRVERPPRPAGRAVANLVDNAAKWSPPGGGSRWRVDDGALSVRDHGPGMPPPTYPSSSTASTARRRPRRARAPGWAWRSCARWPRPTEGSVAVEGSVFTLRLPSGACRAPTN